MKLRNIILAELIVTSGVAVVAYKTGEIVGHLKCLKNVITQNEDSIDTIVDKVSKKFKITITRKTNSSNDD